MFSLDQILEWSAGRIVNREGFKTPLDQISVSKLAPLVGSSSGDLCFFFSREYQSELVSAKPSVLITGEAFVEPLKGARLSLWSETVVIACQDPYLAMAKLSSRFAEKLVAREKGSWSNGVHSAATVHPSAQLGAGVYIGPGCVIERDVSIGENSRLIAGVFVGPGASIGSEAVIFPNVCIYHGCRVGDRVRIHSGAVIGADGFGYAPEKSGGALIGHEKIHHFGRVLIGNDVEIGALTAIDRGTLDDTVVEDLVKIDNFVQIGHNSKVGRGAIFCGCSAIAGGSVVGRFAYLGGRATVINKAVVGDGSMLAANCMVTKDLPAGSEVAGAPHRPLKEHLKIQAHLSRMLKKEGL